jgi:hypothetical protein
MVPSQKLAELFLECPRAMVLGLIREVLLHGIDV